MGRHGGGPGDFDARIARAEQLLATSGPAAEPLGVLRSVLHHQRRRAVAAPVSAAAEQLASGKRAPHCGGREPLLDLGAAVDAIAGELEPAVAALDGGQLPAELSGSAGEIRAMRAGERKTQVAAWLDDAELVAAGLGFWYRVAAGPALELAASIVTPPAARRTSSRCPVCGGVAQVSVIAEESGEFLGGSPRTLVCGQCATQWSFPRAVCPWCGEHDPRCVSGYVEPENRVVRVDCCDVCHGYVKTFDRRESGGGNVIPLVDDVATLALDLWASGQGFHRPGLSFAGV
jgi:formate dehydrogenase maturation protein FdhE